MKSKILKLVAAAMVTVMAAVCLVGCENIPYHENETITVSERFVIISKQGDINYKYHIYVDRDTRVMYLLFTGGDVFNGLTALLNADGTPMLYHGNLD